MRFKWFKTIGKGLKGAAVSAGAVFGATLGSGSPEIAEVVPEIAEVVPEIADAVADSLAVAIVSGDSNRVKVIVISALIGFALEAARNILKQRKLFKQ